MEYLDALAIQKARSCVVTLVEIQVCQVRDDACNPPVIIELTKGRQALFAERVRGHEVRFFTGDVTQVVQRPGSTGDIPDFPEDREALVIERTCTRILPLQLRYIRKVTESPGNVSGVAEVFPNGCTSFEEYCRNGEVAPIASVYG